MAQVLEATSFCGESEEVVTWTWCCGNIESVADMPDYLAWSKVAYLEVLPELHDIGHVNLIERCQHGVCVLSTLEALSHTCPEPGHFDSPLRPGSLAS